MYAQVGIYKTTNRIGQIVWAEVSKDLFEKLDEQDDIIVQYADGYRETLEKKQLRFPSNTRAEIEVEVANNQMEMLKKFNDVHLGLVFHNYWDMGPATTFGFDDFSRETVSMAANYMEDAFKYAPKISPQVTTKALSEMFIEKSIPVVHFGKMKDGKAFYWFLNTNEVPFLKSGIVESPNRIDMFRIIDTVLDALQIKIVDK